ncbi:hypothetical protein ABEQ41_26295 [Priestia megaterium]
MKKAGLWIIHQLQWASNSVEYVSWITAGIFAVLAIFTIFLAHQYQTNTSESVKIVWKIRQGIKNKQKESLRELFQDFHYFSNIPEEIESSLNISIFIIRWLAGVWGVSGLAMIVNEIMEKHSSFPVLSILLLTVTTALFIGFSTKLINTIKKVTSNENTGLAFKNIEEIKNIQLLKEKDFRVDNIIELEDLKFHFEVFGEDPYIEASLKRKFGFTSFSLMLDISHSKFHFLLGIPINNMDEKIEITLKDETKEILNRIFTEYNLDLCSKHLCFLIGNDIHSYKVKSVSKGEPFPTDIELEIAQKNLWEPPIPEKERLLSGEEIELIDLR